MKSRIFTVVILLMASSFSMLWPQPLHFPPLRLSQNADQFNGFEESGKTNFVLKPSPVHYFGDSLVANVAKKHERSVGKAFFLSAAIPGAGEFYNKSFLKGLAFLGVEAGAWAMYAIYTKSGNEKTDEFERFADVHWDETKYWGSLVEDAKRNGKFIDINDRQGLKEYERLTFSHFLPDERNQTYYENIGKYDQFNAGWDDSISGEAKKRDSAHRELYTRMRKKANDQFRIATYGASVVLINHVISALDAAYSTYRFNNKARASLGMKMQRYDQELVPALSLNVCW
ncbi:MAG: hypothetical protein ONB44_03495 [candidate division KSB1 bacterium]|nr:hypothetical protein [candidate division KSB1 bacterium]MDZ7301192.1 hypothetical protein [candidate division KSB1 bacterium]MDZ7310584.1 hypothetical protein [candidate division KSB1 bacterium]